MIVFPVLGLDVDLLVMTAIEVDVVLEVSTASPSTSPIASLKIGDWLAIWTGFGFFEVFGVFVASLVGSLVFDEREVELEVVGVATAHGFMPDIVTERDLIFAFFIDEVAFLSIPVGHVSEFEGKLIGLGLARFDDVGLSEGEETVPGFLDSSCVWGMVIDFDDVFASDFASILDGDGDFAFAFLLVDLMSGDPLLKGGVGFAFAE